MKETGFLQYLILFHLMAVPERRKRGPLARWGRKRRRGIFFESSRKPYKTQNFYDGISRREEIHPPGS